MSWYFCRSFPSEQSLVPQPEKARNTAIEIGKTFRDGKICLFLGLVVSSDPTDLSNIWAIFHIPPPSGVSGSSIDVICHFFILYFLFRSVHQPGIKMDQGGKNRARRGMTIVRSRAQSSLCRPDVTRHRPVVGRSYGHCPNLISLGVQKVHAVLQYHMQTRTTTTTTTTTTKKSTADQNGQGIRKDKQFVECPCRFRRYILCTYPQIALQKKTSMQMI